MSSITIVAATTVTAMAEADNGVTIFCVIVAAIVIWELLLKKEQEGE